MTSALKDSVGTTIGHVKEFLSRLQRSNGEVILHDACTEAYINRLCEVIRLLSDSIEAEKVLELKKRLMGIWSISLRDTADRESIASRYLIYFESKSCEI